MRTSAFVLAKKVESGEHFVFSRKAWPIRGFTFVSSHRTREAAFDAKEKLEAVRA